MAIKIAKKEECIFNLRWTLFFMLIIFEEKQHHCKDWPLTSAKRQETGGLILAASDKSSQTFNWAIQHPGQKIRHGADSRISGKKKKKNIQRGKVMWASSLCVPHNGSR